MKALNSVLKLVSGLTGRRRDAATPGDPPDASDDSTDERPKDKPMVLKLKDDDQRDDVYPLW